MSLITEVIALIVLVVSFIALIRTRKFNARLLYLEEENAQLSKLQRQKLEREEEERTRCEVSAYWYTGENDSDWIAIVNSGAVSAYSIRLEFKPKEGRISPGIEKVMREKFPLEELRPTDEEYFSITRSVSAGSIWPATIYWKNEAGKAFEKDIVLGR